MNSFRNKNVVISGGASGIGKAIIRELTLQGVEQIAVIGRNKDKLQQLEQEFPNINFILFTGDLSRLQHIKDFAARIEQMWEAVDMLINNAGVVSAGRLEDLSDEDIIAQQSINVTGLILLTKYMLPLLKKSPEAAIVNIASSISLIGLPFYTAYAASKGGVKSFSEALRRELKDFPIHVTTVYPKATDTPMMHSAITDNKDTTEFVAKHTINGIKNNQIDVILSDTKEVIANVNHPEEYDLKIASMYNTLEERTRSHRSM